jgi:hypothetical protein
MRIRVDRHRPASVLHVAGLFAYCVAAVSLVLILRPRESLETARTRSRAEAPI